MKKRLKELKGLAKLDAGVYYPPDQGRAQLRGGKQSFAKRLTSNSKPSEENR